MGCKFNPKPSHPDLDVKVTWYWTAANPYQEVIRIDKRTEYSASSKYRGRVKFLMNELENGWAKLQLSNLRINDSGTYQCLVQTAEGTDYKTITLSVGAAYKSVTKRIERTGEKDTVLLTCQSEGYPESAVVWEDGHQQTHHTVNTTASVPDPIFKITSQIQVSSSEKNNYTCTFVNDGYSTTFHIPDEIPRVDGKNDAVIIVVSIMVIMTGIIVGVLAYRRRKETSPPSTTSYLAYDRDMSPSTSTYLKSDQENEDKETTVYEGEMEENLGLYLKTYYSEHILSKEMRQHCESFSVEELLQRLHNNEGHPVTLQDVLPEAGEVVLLEGTPESGKASITHLLMLSWTEGPTQSASNSLDLSRVEVFIYVNCSKVKGELFQEIIAQVSLSEKISTKELQTMLSRSRKSLLLLDGYREGDNSFDESLRSFLSERGNCKVLITTCSGQCPTLKQTLGSDRVLSLQIHYAKY
ncbi:butyrophilin subfamily 2 member A2-like [Cololabis saira]|uniref:butyrophilin subfamily 2 member A2-like n=1 Tax=Cololabis saira TaxID=129043 RepID=UPI002AD36465|nr:butyrophilin subfamily 2 member A2-like [Cololabis saira]